MNVGRVCTLVLENMWNFFFKDPTLSQYIEVLEVWFIKSNSFSFNLFFNLVK